MKITILSLFPELFSSFFKTSIIKNAIKNKKIETKIINFREYSKQKQKKVDAKQIGGGGGMILQLQPLVDCIKQNKDKDSKIILLSPQGKT
jgi:tRNA (guanine37-N1)-methyltransferase